MARFSVGGDEERDDRSRFKRRRILATTSVRRVSDGVNPTYQRLESESESESESERYSPSPSPPSFLAPDSPTREEENQEEEEEEEEEEEVGAVESSNSAGNGVTLSDADVLDCPICLDPLAPPVYQCDNGHLACGTCCIKIRNKCPSCLMPIGYNRCRGMEKVLEAALTVCQNIRHGCAEKVSYCKKLDHEKSCKYAPCSCPHPGCNYLGMNKSLDAHFATCHSDSGLSIRFGESYAVHFCNLDDHIVLQERHERTLFVVNHVTVPLGRLVNVICLAPASSNIKYSFKLTAKKGDNLIMLKSSVELAPKFTVQSPNKNCLLVTRDFRDEIDMITLDITIRKER